MRGQRPAELVLGSVQLGLAYGAANRTGMPSHRTALRLVHRAADSGITKFDTARAYGNSEDRLGEALALRKGIRTITKLSLLSELSSDASRGDVRAALPALRAAVKAEGQASIINISSMYASVAPDSRFYAKPEQASPLHYGPAKAALLQLTRHLAAELGPEKIRVNALVPGPCPRASVAEADPAFAQRLAAKTMLGRTGTRDEIRGPLLFLVSAASSYVTGTALAVDGGWTA